MHETYQDRMIAILPSSGHLPVNAPSFVPQRPSRLLYGTRYPFAATERPAAQAGLCSAIFVRCDPTVVRRLCFLTGVG